MKNPCKTQAVMTKERPLVVWMSLLLQMISLTRTEALQGSRVPAMFLFGASMLDVGTNEFILNSSSLANYPPYGETYFHQPTGRFSNGLIISDFLAKFLGLPLLPPYLKPGADYSQGANFASGGSGLLDDTSEALRVVPFSTQLHQFEHLVSTWKRDDSTIQQKLSKSLFVINAGTNDLEAHLAQATVPSPQFIVQLLKSKHKAGLKVLYQAGARKVVIIGLSPLGCIPPWRIKQHKTGCFDALNELVLSFNAELRRALKELSSELPDLKIIYLKAYDLYMDMINNGSKYGFTVTEDNCCGAGPHNAYVPCGKPVPPNLVCHNDMKISYVKEIEGDAEKYCYKPFLCSDPSKYLFWDQHPTQRGHWFVSKAIWSGDSSLVEPFNLKALVQL